MILTHTHNGFSPINHVLAELSVFFLFFHIFLFFVFFLIDRLIDTNSFMYMLHCCLHYKINPFLSIFILIDAPVVAIEPDGLIAVNESSTVQFWCTYDANPMNISEIRWYKDHRLLDTAFLQQQPNDDENSNKKIFMSRDERGTPMLTIRNIDRNDSANYKCRIRNKFGASDSITTARLEVACMYSRLITCFLDPIKKNHLFFILQILPLYR